MEPHHAGQVHIEEVAIQDASPQEIQELHRHVLRTSPVGNTIQNPVALEAELV